ncbi:MAG: PKD domain-containing protein, partial [Ferruginibacter sp.]
MNKFLMKQSRKLFLIFIGLSFIFQVRAQQCTTLGQNTGTAFPVCGTTVFTQTTVPVCGVRSVPSPCANGPYEDKNPFWYKFTCFASGTLSFNISPLGANEDYDWQLFDITGRDPSEVYTNSSLLVASNWSAEFGSTGASSAGSTLVLCDGPGIPLFTGMPTLLVGHEYILLVSHFSNTQSGYTLSFCGGTAVITDPLEPKMAEASAFCDGKQITIKLNKEMRCNSIAPNGSDFKINYALTSIISATGNDCSSAFEVESVTLTLSNPLPAGNYIITIKKGSDGNTLKDVCDRTIPEDDTIPVTIFPILPTPLDSLTKHNCAPNKLELIFSKPIRCNSIDADGSDFKVTGPYPVNVISAAGDCVNGLTKKITVNLSQPLFTGGTFRIVLAGTIIDECGSTSIIGQFLPFILKDTVSADFSAQQKTGCILDTINYSHNGNHGVNEWLWTFDTDRQSTIRNPQIYYSTSGPKQTKLIVSNGFCRDTLSKTIELPERINAAFEATKYVCPDDLAVFD